MTKEMQVEIPTVYLLTIACYGNIGDGELPDLIQTWAERKCKELGLEKRLHKMREEKISNLRVRLRNTLGKELVDKLEEEISMVASLVKKALK